jgi:hypothetical protein
MLRCCCVTCMPIRRQRRRVATAPISAMRRIHGTWIFATLLPLGPGAVPKPCPLASVEKLYSYFVRRTIKPFVWIYTHQWPLWRTTFPCRSDQEIPCCYRPARATVCWRDKKRHFARVFSRCEADDRTDRVGLGNPGLERTEPRSALGNPCHVCTSSRVRHLFLGCSRFEGN